MAQLTLIIIIVINNNNTFYLSAPFKALKDTDVTC